MALGADHRSKRAAGTLKHFSGTGMSVPPAGVWNDFDGGTGRMTGMEGKAQRGIFGALGKLLSGFAFVESSELLLVIMNANSS